MYFCNPSTQEVGVGSVVLGQLWLPFNFKVSLGYMKSHLRLKKKKTCVFLSTVDLRRKNREAVD